jgi:hypothetical protein
MAERRSVVTDLRSMRLEGILRVRYLKFKRKHEDDPYILSIEPLLESHLFTE